MGAGGSNFRGAAVAEVGADLAAGAFVEVAAAGEDFAAVGAGVEEKWLGEQTTEVLVDLATAVLEVNMDFFVQVLLPRVTAAIGPLGRLSSLGGQTAAA